MNATPKVRSPWGERIEQALAGRSQAWLAREAGVSTTSLNETLKKSMPVADTAIRLAQALEVPVEWLITGKVAETGHGLVAADEVDWVFVPRLQLPDFTETGKPEPIETVPLRRDWLNRTIYTASNLFITTLPAHTLEAVGDEGDPILCRDATHHNEEGVYLYFWDGVPVVRRFNIPRPGQLGEAQNAWTWEPDDPSGLRIVGRILANLKVRSL